MRCVKVERGDYLVVMTETLTFTYGQHILDRA